MRCKRLLALLLCGWSGYAITAPAPCSEPAYRDFDFWIGRWDVHLANGTTAGSNHIAQAENRCLLVENWMGVKGSTGSSMNFYDPVADQWQQIWVSPGVIIDIRGGLEGAAEHKDASMILEGFITYTGIGEPFKDV